MGWHSKAHWGNMVTMPYFLVIGWTIAEIWRYYSFQYDSCPQSWISINLKFSWPIAFRRPNCSNGFQNGGCPPAWISTIQNFNDLSLISQTLSYSALPVFTAIDWLCCLLPVSETPRCQHYLTAYDGWLQHGVCAVGMAQPCSLRSLFQTLHQCRRTLRRTSTWQRINQTYHHCLILTISMAVFQLHLLCTRTSVNKWHSFHGLDNFLPPTQQWWPHERNGS